MEVVHHVEPVHDHHDSGMGFMVGVILLAIFVLLFFYYLLPALRTGMGGPQVNIPGRIDVNLNQPGK